MHQATNLSITLAISLLAACSQPAGAADGARSGGSSSSVTTPYKVGDRLPSAEPDATKSEAAKPAEYVTIKWEQLVPANWDPLAKFRGLNLFMLQDGDPRAQELLDELKREWNNAPTESSMDNQRVRIAGFVVPLEREGEKLREFLLVPYFGACIHVPPPPANQIIYVKSAKPAVSARAMDTLWVSGRLHIVQNTTTMGRAGYQLDAERVEPFK
jgi:hypothetical protein